MRKGVEIKKAICASRVVDPDNMVLDGGQNGVVLALTAPGWDADFVVDGLTIQNGNVTGIEGGGSYINTIATIVLTNNNVISNYSNKGGGGICLPCRTGQAVTLSGNYVKDNVNGDLGGGISILCKPVVTMNESIVINNKSRDGGGISIGDVGMRMNNNIVRGNWSSQKGGGIYYWGDSLQTFNLTNNTKMVRYYGFYNPACRGIARGKRKKNEQDELIPSILEPDGSSGEYKRN